MSLTSCCLSSFITLRSAILPAFGLRLYRLLDLKLRLRPLLPNLSLFDLHACCIAGCNLNLNCGSGRSLTPMEAGNVLSYGWKYVICRVPVFVEGSMFILHLSSTDLSHSLSTHLSTSNHSPTCLSGQMLDRNEVSPSLAWASPVRFRPPELCVLIPQGYPSLLT